MSVDVFGSMDAHRFVRDRLETLHLQTYWSESWLACPEGIVGSLIALCQQVLSVVSMVPMVSEHHCPVFLKDL